MNALCFYRHGGIENLSFEELPEPPLKAGFAIVEVKACALNHLDLWVLKGWKGLKLTFPHIGGSDISGIVRDISTEQTGSQKILAGDAVVVNPGFAQGTDEWTKKGKECLSPLYRIIGEDISGGFSELVSVPVQCLHLIPKHYLKQKFSFENAAAPLLTGLTSLRMLKHRARLVAGESVLIVGAGGGLNSVSIQIAKLLGAFVIALSSSKEKEQKALALGADAVINYKTQTNWHKNVLELTNGRGVDIVVDNVGSKTFSHSILAAARGGRIVTVGNTSGPKLQIDNRYIFSKQLSIIGSTMGNAHDFQELLKLMWKEDFRATIDSCISLQEGKSAYTRLAEGKQFGKIILVP